MAFPQSVAVTVTTIADGSATGYTEVIRGSLITIIYTKVDYADGVDFTITGEDTGQTLWSESDVNAAAEIHPRVPTKDTAAAALLHSSDVANVDQADYIRIPAERVKIVIASGGDTKSGTFTVIYE